MSTNTIDVLIGKTVTDVKVTDNEVIFTLLDAIGQTESIRMYHDQDCCETVYIESIDGDINRLIGQVIMDAYESESDNGPVGHYDESYTWTFYTIRTNLDSVTIRWYGTSNGYYSESVYICKIR